MGGGWSSSRGSGRWWRREWSAPGTDLVGGGCGRVGLCVLPLAVACWLCASHLWRLLYSGRRWVVPVSRAGCCGGRSDGGAILQGPHRPRSVGMVSVGSAGRWWRHSFSLIQTVGVLDPGLALGRTSSRLEAGQGFLLWVGMVGSVRVVSTGEVCLLVSTVRGGGGRDVATPSGGLAMMATSVAS